jgi:hypothetical protein
MLTGACKTQRTVSALIFRAVLQRCYEILTRTVQVRGDETQFSHVNAEMEERIAYMPRLETISELGITLFVTIN